ncbi:flagellar motor protein MotS [Aquibacillus kalidii]|uniref:flagellar motor protein MotS n=1 Tax=Aquibacillus kalidii TaxID=2762597 RepID=UPI001645E2BD|nr:flagellar motor protein MotS [Aquibacillus kalidii]
MKRKPKRVDKGAPKWMVTYSDLITLILVFFILLFSMSQIDLVKFQAVAESFRNRMIFDSYPSPIPAEYPTENAEMQKNNEGSADLKNNLSENKTESQTNEAQQNTNTEVIQHDESLDKLLAEVRKFLNDNQLNNVITANRTEAGVVLVLQEKVLFESGEADIIESGKPFLEKMGKLLQNIPNLVRVEGHTDDRPISNYRYPSNWELSGARASSVIRYVIKTNKIDETRFISVGYGDTRPIVENDSEANWSKNRRVEVVILEINENSN